MAQVPDQILPEDFTSPERTLVEAPSGLANALVLNLMTFVTFHRATMFPTEKRMCAKQIKIIRRALELHAPETLEMVDRMDAKREEAGA